MKGSTWPQVEEELRGDAFAEFYELEMRRALLDSNRLPELRERLEREIRELETRLAEIARLYFLAKARADRERAASANADALDKAGSADFPRKNVKTRRHRAATGA